MRNSEYARKQLQNIRARIMHAAKAVGRDPSSITLVGAAKQQDVELVAAFGQAGLKDVGENYLIQGIEKRKVIGQADFTWHFIGHIQSNKTKAIAQHFSWIHGVDRFKIARRLSDHAVEDKPLQLLIQVDIDNETSKGGIPPEQVAALCEQVADLPNIKLRGLMVLPRVREGFQQQREPFARARQLLAKTNLQLDLAMDTLSMGMSGDLEAAIAEGSTMVRIGSDLFGPRAS